MQMWKIYEVTLKMEGKFAASLPNTRDAIEGMLRARMPGTIPDKAIPIEELANKIAGEMGLEQEEGSEEAKETKEAKFGYATFKRYPDTGEFYYEGRCIRGHIKDCANIIKEILKITALKAKVANRLYIITEEIPLGKNKPDGTETRFVQAMTAKGPISTIKFIDYLDKPILKFMFKFLNDDVIKEDTLKAIFDYGSLHGLGQERSQGWGRYSYELKELGVSPDPKTIKLAEATIV